MIAQEVIRRARSPQEEAAPLPPPPYQPHSNEDITHPSVPTPVPYPRGNEDPYLGGHTPMPGATKLAMGSGQRLRDEPRGAILGIGMAPIGQSPVTAVAGEIAPRVTPGARVLVPGPNGLMQSATVRQLLHGYYELEVGHSGETIWVPVHNVVPER
jgi:hypothetical protein